MAAPTRTQAWTQIKQAVALLDILETSANAASTGYIVRWGTLDAAAVYDYSAEVMAAVRGQRADLGSLLSPKRVQDILVGPMLDMMAAISAPDVSDLPTMAYRLREDMLGQVSSIKSRNFSYGTPAAGGGNVGNGTLKVLTVDEDGYNLDAGYSELKSFECLSAQDQTERHQERFEVKGPKPELDYVNIVGSGFRGNISCLSTKESSDVILNPTFSQFSGTAPAAGAPQTPATTTSITGWTLDATTGVTVQADTVYRDLTGETNKWAVNFTVNRTLEQILQNNKKPKLNQSQPYYIQIAVYRASSADGTLTFTWGNASKAVVGTTLNNAAWNIITFTLDKNLYYKNFKKDLMSFKLAITGMTTGTWSVDDIVIGLWTPLDGLYYGLCGGATPFAYKDTFTVTHTQNATRAKLAYWMTFRSGLGLSFPSKTDASETIADPT